MDVPAHVSRSPAVGLRPGPSVVFVGSEPAPALCERLEGIRVEVVSTEVAKSDYTIVHPIDALIVDAPSEESREVLLALQMLHRDLPTIVIVNDADPELAVEIARSAAVRVDRATLDLDVLAQVICQLAAAHAPRTDLPRKTVMPIHDAPAAAIEEHEVSVREIM